MRIPPVIVRLQAFPGVHGRDWSRALAGLPYSVSVAGTTTSGSTNADGDVLVDVPFGVTSFWIHVLGTDFEIVLVDELEPLRTPPHLDRLALGGDAPELAGLRQRLELLGYGDPTNVDVSRTLDDALDEAILRFQANEGADPTGVIDRGLVALLARRTGG